MAEIKSFPNNQDVYVGAEWVMKWLHGRTSGVFGAENNLATSIVPDSMSVEISDGVGWLSNANGDGIVFWNDSEQSGGSKLTLTHDVADGVLDRIDRIVVTWETTNYVALPTISILKGIASSKPVPPTLTNNTTQRQISIARVKIPAGIISVSASMITDERLDPDVCGIVTETIKIDTSTMQSQFEALLKSIQNELQDLNDDTAALLKAGGTMYGGINMNGQKLSGLNAPTTDDEPATKGYVDTSKLSLEMLWKNGSPTSKFDEQRVYIDGVGNTEQYPLLLVLTERGPFFATNSVGSKLYLAATYGLTSGGVAYVNSRTTNINDGNLYFFKAVELSIKSSSVTHATHTDRFIPLEVYGVKGVSA